MVLTHNRLSQGFKDSLGVLVNIDLGNGLVPSLSEPIFNLFTYCSLEKMLSFCSGFVMFDIKTISIEWYVSCGLKVMSKLSLPLPHKPLRDLTCREFGWPRAIVPMVKL